MRWASRRVVELWGLRPALWHRGPSPLKGLTDNPVYQWWRDPHIMQPDSWWEQIRQEGALEAQITLMRELGVRLFRVEFPWRALAPERPGGMCYDAVAARDPAWPGYRWERVDRLVWLMRQAGIWLVPQVVFAPEWSTGVRATKSGGATVPPGAPEHVADFLTALVQRYRGQIQYWELWNEPDHPHFWSGTLRQYVELVLQPGATAIRAVAAGCHVLLGGLAGHQNLRAIYGAGGGPYFDIVNFHLYPTRPGVGQVLRALRQVRAELRRCGEASKPIWLTECGLATQPPSTPSPFGGVTYEAGQARFIRALYRSLPVQAICWYQLRDTVIVDAAGRELKRVYWGLVSRDLMRCKSGYEAYRRLTSPLPADGPVPVPKTPRDPPTVR